MFNRNRIYFPVVWSLVILALCLLPKSELPEDRFFDIPHFDKLVHFGLFSIFFFSLQYSSPGRWLQNIFICIVYGGLVELLQETVPTGRTAEWMDLLADTLGATFAAVFALTVKRLRLV